MSDTFILCPKCGEELVKEKYNEFYVEEGLYIVFPPYHCANCNGNFYEKDTKKVTTEYIDKDKGG